MMVLEGKMENCYFVKVVRLQVISLVLKISIFVIMWFGH